MYFMYCTKSDELDSAADDYVFFDSVFNTGFLVIEDIAELILISAVGKARGELRDWELLSFVLSCFIVVFTFLNIVQNLFKHVGGNFKEEKVTELENL